MRAALFQTGGLLLLMGSAVLVLTSGSTWSAVNSLAATLPPPPKASTVEYTQANPHFKPVKQADKPPTASETPESKPVTTPSTDTIKSTAEPLQLRDPQEPVVNEEADAQPQALADLYRKNQSRNHFTSSGYLFQVIAVLVILLFMFYIAMRVMVAKGLIPNTQTRVSKPAKNASWFSGLLSAPKARTENTYKPKVISHTRLTPTKELHVIEIADKHLLIGSTAQQMTLLADLPQIQSLSPQADLRAPETADETIYKKYLDPKDSQKPNSPASVLPDTEEIELLDDYADAF